MPLSVLHTNGSWQRWWTRVHRSSFCLLNLMPKMQVKLFLYSYFSLTQEPCNVLQILFQFSNYQIHGVSYQSNGIRRYVGTFRMSYPYSCLKFPLSSTYKFLETRLGKPKCIVVAYFIYKFLSNIFLKTF